MDEPGKVIGPSWQFKAEDQKAAPAELADDDAVSWTASEYISHQKNAGWYLLLIIGAVALTAAVFLITKDTVSAAMIVIVAVIMMALAARKPRTLSYKVDNQGVYVGQKFYPWDGFKSFSILEEGAVNSIYLVPLKRFMPAISMYYAPDDEAKILNVLATYLPHEDRELDFVDRLMHKIRF